MSQLISYKSNHVKLLEIKVSHEFFENRKCFAFEFLPAKETLFKLKNLDILVRTEKDGLNLIGTKNDRFTEKHFKGNIDLRFKMILKDKLFFNYTNIDFRGGFKYEFRNNFESFNLHQDQFVNGESIVERSYEMWSADVILNLSLEKDIFAYINKTSTFKFKTYNIKFDAREVIPRYNIMTSIDEKDFNYYIEAENDIFSNFYTRELSNGKNVISFDLDYPLKLKQFLNQRLYLKKRSNYFNSFSKVLPQPGTKNVSYDEKKSIFYADLFLSLV